MAAISTLPSITNPRMRMPQNNKPKKKVGLFGAVSTEKKKLPGLSVKDAQQSLSSVEKRKLPTYKGMKVTKTKKLPNMTVQSTKKLNKMPTSTTY